MVESKPWRDAWIAEMIRAPRDGAYTFWAGQIVEAREDKISSIIMQVVDDVDDAQARLAARLIVGYLLSLSD